MNNSKSLIAKTLILGSLFTGLGFIACENKKDNANEYENIPTETTADDGDMTAPMSGNDSTGTREGISNDPKQNSYQDSANTNNNINNNIVDSTQLKR